MSQYQLLEKTGGDQDSLQIFSGEKTNIPVILVEQENSIKRAVRLYHTCRFFRSFWKIWRDVPRLTCNVQSKQEAEQHLAVA